MTYDDSPLLPSEPRLALDQPIQQGEVRAGAGTSEAPAPPDCRWCGGRGYYIGGDEEHVCWCKRDEAEAAGKPLSW